MNDEQQPVKSKEELSREYSQLAMQLGDFRYKLYCLELDINNLMARMLEINKIASAQDKLAAEAPAKAVEAEVVQ